jgi:hypothetical protein
MMEALTERDAGVLLADVLALLVGEEHVGGETTLGGVGVWERGSSQPTCSWRCSELRLTLLATALLDLAGGLALSGGLGHFDRSAG